jgi:hypothetical protein
VTQVAIANGYLTLDQAKHYVGAQTSDNDVLLEDAVNTASRAIDAYCSRRFYVDTNASARTFRPATPYLAVVDDISSTTGLVVKTDDGDDGTHETTWTIVTDFELEPADGVGPNGQTGWPFWQIHVAGSRTFPTANRHRPLSVTAKWGWAAVPDDVEQACRILVAKFFKVREAPLGVAGFGDLGLIRVRDDPTAMGLLRPYRRLGSGVLVA